MTLCSVTGIAPRLCGQVQRIAVACPARNAGLLHGANNLLDEERVALGTREDLIQQAGIGFDIVEQRGDEQADRIRRKPDQADLMQAVWGPPHRVFCQLTASMGR